MNLPGEVIVTEVTGAADAEADGVGVISVRSMDENIPDVIGAGVDMVGVAPMNETLVTIVTWDGIIVVSDIVAGETLVALIDDETLLVTWVCITVVCAGIKKYMYSD